MLVGFMRIECFSNLQEASSPLLFNKFEHDATRRPTCNKFSGGATLGRARSNDSAGRSIALAPPCLLLCFASVRVWTKNKNVTISDRFICFIFTVKQSQRRWRPLCFEGDDWKKIVNFFEEKSTSGWPSSRMFWPRIDLALLLRCSRHWTSL